MVSVLVVIVNTAKMAELIEVLFGMLSCMGNWTMC